MSSFLIWPLHSIQLGLHLSKLEQKLFQNLAWKFKVLLGSMGNSHILLTKFFLRGQQEDHNLEQKVFSLHILHCASNVGAELFHQETTSQLQSAPPIKHTVRMEGRLRLTDEQMTACFEFFLTAWRRGGLGST